MTLLSDKQALALASSQAALVSQVATLARHIKQHLIHHMKLGI